MRAKELKDQLRANDQNLTGNKVRWLQGLSPPTSRRTRSHMRVPMRGLMRPRGRRHP